MKKKLYDVLIVGAGMSGLSAALVAKEQGLSYKVIDARNRIGGRVYSQKLRSGLVIERGGEWIGKSHKELLTFCRKYNIPLEKHQYKDARYFFNTGKEFKGFEALLTNFETYAKGLRPASIPVNEDWYSFLRERFTEEEMEVIASVYESDYGVHMRYIGARDGHTEFMGGGDTGHLDYHVKGGNIKIIQTLVREIGRKHIKLETEVRAVHDAGDMVVVETSKGSFYAKKVILTIALPEYREVSVRPALKEKKDVARSITYGNITKAFLSFKGHVPFRKQDFSMLSDTDIPYVFLATQGQSEKRFALCIYAVGPLAKKVHRLRHDVLERKLKAILPKDTFDVDRMELEEIVVQNWGTDRYTKGAYCHYGPGKHDEVRKAFGVPHGNIYFAGAYLGNFSGYMNGAFQSGRDTMRLIVKEQKRSRRTESIRS